MQAQLCSMPTHRRGCSSTQSSRPAARITTRSSRLPGGSAARSPRGLPNGGGRRARDTFAVVRADNGGVEAFSTTATVDPRGGPVREDPMVRAVGDHLRDDPMPTGTDAVMFRWALGRRHGERPTPEVATLVIDLKRTYLQLRATLRRVYTVVTDWPAAAPVLRVMGFDSVTEVVVGGRRFVLACLDFGPGGVDAWIGRHVLAEQAGPVPAQPRHLGAPADRDAESSDGPAADRPSRSPGPSTDPLVPPHRSGAGGARPARPGVDQYAAGRGALHQRAHCQQARQQHLHQARRAQPHTGSPRRGGRRPGRLTGTSVARPRGAPSRR